MSSKSDSTIQTFLRIKPSKQPSGYFKTDELDHTVLSFNLPDNFKSDYINNSKLKHNFNFNGIIDPSADQEHVFKKVGVLAIQNALDGFNSTIFAYGQTGSGKTFTLTGGTEKYSDRGIIPRSISMLFNEFRNRTDVQFKVYISYLEIYNEQGYDLLDPSQETKSLEDLPKVALLEDEHGNFHLKNLSMHVAETEEEALNLLFLGDTNRAIAETPMNMASSRSHCIFSISLEARFVGNDRIRRSKLHLVDLAGSERVSKTNSSGSVLTEAKYINSSLFFLEMVIVALHEKATKGRTHVPYRNSMMTSVLRDSLGGNCKTIMIATINPEASHTEESISTCRFANRVSMIKNKVSINEEQDPLLVIKRLKGEIMNLREEIAFLKGETEEGENLTMNQIEELKTSCRDYCFNPDPNSTLNIGAWTLLKLREVFSIMKALVLETSGGNGGRPSTGKRIDNQADSSDIESLKQQISNYKSLLSQRDSEINILVNMVKKGKTADDPEDNNYQEDFNNFKANINKAESKSQNKIESSSRSEKGTPASSSRINESRDTKIIKRYLYNVPPPKDSSIFEDAAKSFEWFRENCSLNSSMNENKELLKSRIEEAKVCGERANQSRNTINYLKNSIESIRRERALQQINLGDGDSSLESEEEVTYRRAIEQEKLIYKENFDRLRVLKPEIEHIRKILEKCRLTMQKQFEQWYSVLHSKGLVNEMDTSSNNNNNDYKAEDKAVVDDQTNEDIQAFYQAKEELLNRRGGR